MALGQDSASQTVPTTPDRVLHWEDLEWTPESVLKNPDQREAVKRTVDSLAEIAVAINQGAGANYFNGSTRPFLSPEGRLLGLVPILGPRTAEKDERLIFLTDIVALTEHLSFLLGFDPIVHDGSLHASNRALNKYFDTIKQEVDGELLDGFLEEVRADHRGDFSSLVGQLQSMSMGLDERAEKQEKVAKAAKEEEADAGKSVEIVGKVATAKVLGGAAKSTTEGASESGSPGEPVAQPTTSTQPQPTDTTRQPLVTDVERERRRMYGYESAWLTSAILHDLCGQHGLQPTPELLRALREQVDSTIGNYSAEQFERMFANPAERINAYRILQTKLASDATSFQFAYHALIDSHINKLQKQNPQSAQDFAQKLGYDSTTSATIPKFSVSEDSLNNLADQALQNTIVPLLGQKALNEQQKSSLEVVLTQLALGMGDKSLINTTESSASEKSVDVAAYLASLNENDLYRLIYGQTANKKTDKEILKFIKQNKEEIQNNLINACRLVIAEKGQQLGLSMAKGSTRLVKHPSFDFPLTPKQALNRTFLVTQATGISEERAGQVAALAASEDRLSAAEQAYQQFVKQFQATYNSLDPIAQQILIRKAGLEPQDLEDLDGSYKFDVNLMRAAGDLSKVLKDAQKAREAQTKIQEMFQELEILDLRQQKEVDRLINGLYDIGLHAEANQYVEQLFGEESKIDLLGQPTGEQTAVASELPIQQALVESGAGLSTAQPELNPEFGLAPVISEDIDGEDLVLPDTSESGSRVSGFTRRVAGQARKFQQRRKTQKLAYELAKKAGTKSATAALTAATGGAAAPVAGLQLLIDKRTRKPFLIGLGSGVVLTGLALWGKLGATAGGVFGGLGAGAIGAIGGFIVGGPVGAVIGGLAGGTLGASIGVWRGGGSPFGLGEGATLPTPPAYYSPSAPTFTPAASTTTLAPSQAMAGSGAGPPGLAEPVAGGITKNASLSPEAVNNAASRFSPQPGGQWVDPTTGYRFDPNTGQVFDSAGKLVDPTGSTITPAATAAGATAGAVGIAAVIGPLGLSGAAFFMPAISVLSVMFITLITIITIFAAFLTPMPSKYAPGEATNRSKYATVDKVAVPDALPNNPRNEEVTYTVKITANPTYRIQVTEIKDSFYYLPPNQPKPTITVIDPPPTSVALAANSPSQEYEFTYKVSMTGGVDVGVFNRVELTYQVTDPVGNVIGGQAQKSIAYALVKIGDPELGCFDFDRTGGTKVYIENGRFLTSQPMTESDVNAIIFAFSKRAGSNATFNGLLCSDGNISIRKLPPNNPYWGWRNTPTSIVLYAPFWTASALSQEYSLIHELSHMIDYRNSGKRTDFEEDWDGSMLTYPITGVTTASEAFAEAIAVYVTGAANYTDWAVTGYPLKSDHPAVYDWVKINIFGNIEYFYAGQ